MKKIFKRIAAMSAAVMMMASISSMGVSALNNTFSLYITNYANVNTKKCEAGYSQQAGMLTTTVRLNSVSSGAGITYTTQVEGLNLGSSSKITKKGSHSLTHFNNYIKRNKLITMTVKLAPSPTGIGSSAGGTVSGS